jgi:hypothetical protein
MKRTKLALLVTGIICAIGAAFVTRRVVAGGIPAMNTLTYSGLLQDGSGTALTGMHQIQVGLWPMVSGGTSPLCQTASSPIMLDGGRFSVALPDTCVTGVQGSADVWAEVLVDGTPLAPRAKLGAVPYAVEAKHAVGADNATSATSATGLTCYDPTAPTKYGFCIWHDDNGASYTQNHQQAAMNCQAKGGRLCTYAEVAAAWALGAEWCAFGWVADTPVVTNADITSGYVSYPMQSSNSTGCHKKGVSFDSVALTASYDANCCR